MYTTKEEIHKHRHEALTATVRRHRISVREHKIRMNRNSVYVIIRHEVKWLAGSEKPFISDSVYGNNYFTTRTAAYKLFVDKIVKECSDIMSKWVASGSDVKRLLKNQTVDSINIGNPETGDYIGYYVKKLTLHKDGEEVKED